MNDELTENGTFINIEYHKSRIAELGGRRGDMSKKTMSVREFLADIAANELLPNKKYDLRIDMDDGGYNSYIGLKVDLDDWKSKGKIRSLWLFRHTNGTDRLSDTWQFSLGEICNEYHAHPNIPIKFTSFGKAPGEAEAEVAKYYSKLRRLVRKQTSDYKIAQAETAQTEREGRLIVLPCKEGKR